MRTMMLSHAAPGSTLLLDETGLHDRLDALCAASATLTLRPDGAGGLDLTCAGDPLAELERLAWGAPRRFPTASTSRAATCEPTTCSVHIAIPADSSEEAGGRTRSDRTWR